MVNEVPNKLEFDNEPIANLLRELERVDVPKDFDHRVRARIAQGRPETKRGFGIPGWAMAVPAALVLAAGGYVGINSMRESRPQAPTTVASSAPPSRSTGTPVMTEPTQQVPVKEPEVAAVRPSLQVKGPGVKAPARKKPVTVPAGSSEDSALRVGKTIEVADVPAAEALTRSGAKVTFDGDTLKVDSTDGAANRSGLKPGDVIESIEGRAVDAKSSVKGNAAGKKLRVRRDGKTLDIVIRN